MKVLDLQCSQAHGFEGWFASEDEFQDQLARGLLECPMCGDAQVTNLSSFLQARTMGLPLLGPALFEPYGLSETTGPLSSAFVMFTEDPTPLPPETNLLNGEGNSAHGELRKRAAVVEQIGTFLSTGEIVHTCTGPCECAEGACGALDPP